MNALPRHSTGVPGLDEQLGGGLLPGAMTVVVGATGIGKTQLALQYAAAGQPAEGHRGVLFDVSSRGDSQSHAEYAQRMFSWPLSVARPDRRPALDDFFAPERDYGDYLHVFDYHGRRVTRQDLSFDEWQHWQADLNARLATTIGFLYGNFARGVRRLVIDGIEPVDRPSDSIQMNLIEYVYHQVLRKDPLWVARDLFREKFLANSSAAEAHLYDPAAVSCLLMYTSPESMLDDLISRSLDEGDLLSNANTLIYMGKVRTGTRIGRAIYVAKHRGSACAEEILPYTIDDAGVKLA